MTTAELMTVNTTTGEVQPAAPLTFSRERIDLIKRTVAVGVSDDELQLFLYQCQRTGLDPFARQIYSIKRRSREKHGDQWRWVEKATTQTSIDGFRVIANRTGEYDGHDVAWCGQDGIWREVWLDALPPAAAKVIAYRKGCAHPFPAIAKWTEYVQANSDGDPTGMWKKMPATMLAKCAESLALRKAFPHELSGVYTVDELPVPDDEPAAAPPRQVPHEDIAAVVARKAMTGAPDAVLISDAQRRRFIALVEQHGWKAADVSALLAQHGIAKSSQIPRAKYDALCQVIEQGDAAHEPQPPLAVETPADPF